MEEKAREDMGLGVGGPALGQAYKLEAFKLELISPTLQPLPTPTCQYSFWSQSQ